MIVWLNGEKEQVAAAARIIAAALEQRSFKVHTLVRGENDAPDAVRTAATEENGDEIFVIVAAGSFGAELPKDQALEFALESGGDPGRAAEGILKDLEDAGHLKWGYSREEEAEIQKHLEDLGYM